MQAAITKTGIPRHDERNEVGHKDGEGGGHGDGGNGYPKI